MLRYLAGFVTTLLTVLHVDHGEALVCDPVEYETCSNRFFERDFTFFEQVIKLYPHRRMRLDATEITQFCLGFDELVQCLVTQYLNCDAPELEKEKEILRFERLLDRRHTCNALIDHGRCILGQYGKQNCANWNGRSALDKTIRSWGGTYCSGAVGPQNGLEACSISLCISLLLYTIIMIGWK
ncbi:hypothetical protein BIW11_06371 [Tropilaelaps mercedesae]|uniref:Uncharacterized protein n=1 Tax=Tropilaelaps mercedesae TaxID=418985 RepID=A0A1V9XYD5_9ACAR|nr:hypothetical protein BIW11_06371 [Tropilaelaps mercedesae]